MLAYSCTDFFLLFFCFSALGWVLGHLMKVRNMKYISLHCYVNFCYSLLYSEVAGACRYGIVGTLRWTLGERHLRLLCSYLKLSTYTTSRCSSSRIWTSRVLFQKWHTCFPWGSNKIEWPKVMNCALRSNNTSHMLLPQSTCMWVSLNTLTRRVSVSLTRRLWKAWFTTSKVFYCWNTFFAYI